MAVALMNPVHSAVDGLLAAAAALLETGTADLDPGPDVDPTGPLRIGVDLGTASCVLVVLRGEQPIWVGAEPSGALRDGVVVDFARAAATIGRLKQAAEAALGLELADAATAYPPGIPVDDARACRFVCEAAGFEAIVLYTDKPGLYEPYGFRTFREQSFAGPVPASGGRVSATRRLSVESPEDLALLRAALSARSPVSQRVAVCDQALMFLLNAWLVDDVTLTWLEEARAVIAWRIGEAGDFELLDIAAAEIPPLADIAASLGVTAPRAVVHFPPDRLDWPGEAMAPQGDLVFMMRAAPGLWPQGPFRLSPMAEF